MGYKTITQITLAALSLIIIFVYIQPTLITIGDNQDQLFEYTDTANKASELNSKLSELLAAEQSFKKADIEALETYLPSTIDDMTVMADITEMVHKNGLLVDELISGELQSPEENIIFEGESIVSDGVSYKDFILTVSGPYEPFKAMLNSFERNKYPLEFIELTLSGFAEEDGTVVVPLDFLKGKYRMVLRTYAF